MSIVAQVCTLVRYEWLQEWRRQTKLFGLKGALALPLLVLVAYGALNTLFFLLLAGGHGIRSIPADSAIHGWLLLALFGALLAIALPATFELAGRRANWDLIRSSPFSQTLFKSAKLLAVALRTAIVSLFLLSPAANARIAFGQHSLLWLYPGVLGMACISTAASVFIATAATKAGRGRSLEQIARLLGLGAAGLVSIGCLIHTDMHSIGEFARRIEQSAPFRPLRWMGLGLSSSPAASMALLVLGFTLLALSIPVVGRLAKDTPMENSAAISTQAKAIRFPRSLTAATIRREWLLLKRDPHIYMDVLRLLMVSATMVILALQEARGFIAMAMTGMVIITCSVLSNDASWRMVANERLPSLLLSSPSGFYPLVRAKGVAACLPSVTALAIGTIALACISSSAAFWTLGFGLCAITSSVVLNAKPRPWNTADGEAIVSQGGIVLLVQAICALAWLAGDSLALLGRAIWALIPLAVVSFLVVVHVLRIRSQIRLADTWL